MAYDPTKQYRCDIVRSRSIRYTDDLLPAYANIIDTLCPCNERDFISGFNNALKIYLLSLGCPANEKALNNHRTETAKTLFGMYYVDHLGNVQSSERTKQYLIDRDQPAFFKDICYKLQFPNGMTKNPKLKQRIDDGIQVYPCRFLLETMQIAEKEGILLTKQEAGYYVLNAFDVLTGKSSPSEVVSCIKKDRKNGIIRTIPEGSYNWQHITGLITYLEYANLVVSSKGRTKDKIVLRLNNLESPAISIFVRNREEKLAFDVKKYVLGSGSGATVQEGFRRDWDIYNSEISDQYFNFYTLPTSLGITGMKVPAKPTVGFTAAIGAVGEKYVFDYEVARVEKINPAYKFHVKDRSHERRIGFDIESICASGKNPLEEIYIEVKTTSRVTEPSGVSAFDMVNLTHYEWKAACDYGDRFFLYRVYLVKGKVLLYIIGDVSAKESAKLIEINAPSYQVRFDAADVKVVDKIENIV